MFTYVLMSKGFWFLMGRRICQKNTETKNEINKREKAIEKINIKL